jgi:internalin A
MLTGNSRLTNLQHLNLSRNRLTTIPEGLSRLTNLYNLDLSNNEITAVPEGLSQLTSLQSFYLHANSGLGIPDEILGPADHDRSSPPRSPASPAAILDYYFKQRQDRRPLHEAKLILVGQGGVGKTSRLKTLLTREFNRREKTTQGIKITDWSLTLHRKDKITVHIWDFGGQEMEHATHRFFLTKRALYLLVLNRRQGNIDKEAGYWFRMIRAAGGDEAPVIVVLNKKKEEPFDVNRAKWLEEYKGNIKGFVETDCADLPSMSRLRRKIEEEFGRMKELNEGFPAAGLALRRPCLR